MSPRSCRPYGRYQAAKTESDFVDINNAMFQVLTSYRLERSDGNSAIQAPNDKLQALITRSPPAAPRWMRA